MTYEQLKYFISIYETGGINQAAKTAFISPQGISSGIKSFEKELGAQLFTRSTLGLKPTDFSKTIYPIIKEITDKMDEIKNAASDCIRNNNTIKMCALGHNSITDRIREVTSGFRYKDIKYNFDINIFDSSDYKHLFDMLDTGEADMVCSFHTDCEAKYNYHTFSKGVIKCAVSPNHPLATKSTLIWEDFIDQDIIFPENGGLFQTLIDSQCKKFGFTPRAKYYSLDSNYIAKRISTGTVIGLFFGDYIDRIYESCSDIKFIDVLPHLEISTSIITRADCKSSHISGIAESVKNLFGAGL